jgi:pseudouridine-5'-phosphate glycosidase
VPVPAAEALPGDAARAAVARAVAEAEEVGIHGPATTPWLLARIAEITDGASVRANTALIVNDARVAGQLASALTTIRS